MNVRITRQQPTYDCGIEIDGEPLKIKSIKKSQFEMLENMKSDGAKITDVYNFVGVILNANTAGITVPQSDVDELDLATVTDIFKGYSAFLRGLTTSPN